MEKLYKIRPYRRIEKEDMNKIWPDWKIDDINLNDQRFKSLF